MELYQNVPQRVFDLLPKYEKEFGPEKEIIAGKENGEWKRYSIRQTREIVDNISYALLKIGIKKGDKIALVSKNCPEWNLIDWAVQQIGAVCVPLYPTISEADYKYNLNHSETKVIFIYGNEIYRKIANVLPEVPSLQGLYSVKAVEGFGLLSDLIELGKQNSNPQLLNEARSAVLPSDLATIIYTSGTTGTPKGVMLTHNNMISNMMCLDALFPASKETVLLSYLPLSHIYEREVVYSYINMGAMVYYAESLGTIVDNIAEVKPTVFGSIPRLIEKIHYKLITKGQKMKGIKKTIFFKALELGYRYDECGENSLFYRLQQKLADKLVYSKIRETFGGRLECIILGGAAIQPRLAKLFTAMKIPIMEGYGLTETSPVIAVNSPVSGKVKIGTVGHPVQNVEVKISDEGEILVKGPSVMKGYYKSPEQTAEVLDKDGWFHTGDKGLFDDQGFLKITGRLKDIFKTSMGKFISPTVIENMLLESPFINSIMVVGEGQKFAAALIVPNFEHFRSWCKIKAIPYTTDEEMVKSTDIIMRMRKEIDKYNKSLGDYQRIMKFELLNADWSIDKGEMTGTMKMKRSAIQEHYQYLIDKIYAENGI